jgi:hypothetical protein
MRILVTGSRTWLDTETLTRVLTAYYKDGVEFLVGDARGADAMTKALCAERGWPCREYRADWQRWGKYAGPRRNREMLDEEPVLVLAFRVGGEASRGTTDCVMEARRRGINTIVYDWPGEAPRRLHPLDRRR